MSITLDGTAGVVVSGNTNTLSGITVGRGAGAVSTNTAVGASALNANTTGLQNTAVGQLAMRDTTTGQENTVFGRAALYQNTTGSANTAMGVFALGSNTTANNNTAVGYQAAYSNTGTGARLTFVGYQAGYSTVGGTSCGFGSEALYSNTTGDDNTAIGSYRTLYSNTTGSSNVAVGRQALQANTTASNNTAVGYQAGYNVNGSNYSVFVGSRTASTGASVVTGNYHTCVGDAAGYALQGASSTNALIGQNSGSAITTGSKNTVIGSYTGNQGGLDIRTASNYIVLSDGDGNPRGIFESGNFLVGSTTNALTGGVMVIPNNGNSLVRVGHVAGTGSTSYYAQFYYDSNLIGSIQQSGTTAVTYLTSSDYRLKNTIAPMTGALAKIAALKPVTYKWNADNSDGQGFIAHELAEVFPEAVGGEKDAVDEDGNPKYQGIDTSFLVATLTAAIQELKAEFDAYKATHP